MDHFQNEYWLRSVSVTVYVRETERVRAFKDSALYRESLLEKYNPNVQELIPTYAWNLFFFLG